MINEVGINEKCGGYLRLIPLVPLLVPPTLLLLVPPGGTKPLPCYDQMMMYAGPDEWRKMFDASRFFCFKCDGFEIVQTATMGLGKYY